ncbi:MAG: hypothetical protein AAB250_12850, partial [Bdellovibrionota bacterium]
DYRAIERIVAGKQPRRSRIQDPVGLDTQQLEKYLEGAGTHQRGLEVYRSLQERSQTAAQNHHDDEEDTDGK